MSYNDDLQSNNEDLVSILTAVQSLPSSGSSGWEEIINFTTTNEAIEFFIDITAEQNEKILNASLMTFEVYATASEDSDNVTTTGALSAFFYCGWNNGTLFNAITNSVPDAVTSWKKWVRTVGVYFINKNHGGLLSAPIGLYRSPQNQSITTIMPNSEVACSATMNFDFYKVNSLHVLGTQPLGVGSTFKLYVR